MTEMNSRLQVPCARPVEMGLEATRGASRMNTDQICAAQPAQQPASHCSGLMQARHQMLATNQWTPSQFMGRRWPIGCVALEITQRCNLDCSACYLSENSELVKDLPLDEIFRRIEMIFAHYGPNTDVQVTGGDPTLRKRAELVEIVRRLRQKGMRPSLVTNGIRAKRDLLQELSQAGLVDVVFHVDMTQERKGFDSEMALNVIRQEYIERARGLRLSIMFNTTVFDGNFEEVPDIVAFFVRNADVVRFASFQLQADTGRGTLGQRDARLRISSLKQRIAVGARRTLSFDTAHIGHSDCNRYAMALVVNGRVYDALDDQSLFDRTLQQTAHLQFDRQSRFAAVMTLARGMLGSPSLALAAIVWLARKIWEAKTDIFLARGRVHKLSFFIHDFMDSCRLDSDRVDACVFSAMTASGPICMCLHNAKRDAFILEPVRSGGPIKERYWNPGSGNTTDRPERIFALDDPQRKDKPRGRGRLLQRRANAQPN